MSRLVLLFITAGLLTSCSYTMEELGFFKSGDPFQKGFGLEGLAEKPVDFSTLKMTTLSSCLECHTQGAYSMNTPEKVMSQISEIRAVIADGSMPPKASGYAPLTDCEKQILEIWADDQSRLRAPGLKVGELSRCGNVTPSKPKPKIDFTTLELTFENLTKALLAPKCLTCHTEESARKTVLDQLDLYAAQGLLADSPENSLLLQVVTGQAKRFMPPKKSGIPALAPEEIDYIKRWIEAGSPL